jgi:hypothetical protein
MVAICKHTAAAVLGGHSSLARVGCIAAHSRALAIRSAKCLQLTYPCSWQRVHAACSGQQHEAPNSKHPMVLGSAVSPPMHFDVVKTSLLSCVAAIEPVQACVCRSDEAAIACTQATATSASATRS